MTSWIMVTGGAGFIGSTLVRRLIDTTDFRVVNIDALTYAGNLESLTDVAASARYAFEQVDIRNPRALRRVLKQYSPRSIVHLAAESHVDRSIDGPAAFIGTNVIGTYALLEAALEFWDEAERPQEFRFIHVSTDEVFGSLGDEGHFTEGTPYAPNSPYAATKAAADHLVRSWHKTYGLPVITTNCSNNYGPRQFPEKLIPHMIITALEGGSLPVYGDGGQVRDWLHVEDHVDALLAVMDNGRVGEVYAIGARNERRNIDVVRAICEHLDVLRPRAEGGTYADLLTHVPDRPGHDRRYAIDPTKIESELGWQSARDMETGLRDTVRWYLDHESWWQRIRSGAYRGKRLGARR